MASSHYRGHIDYDPGDIAADEPISSGLAFQIVNNANHLADQSAQVRVAWAGVELQTDAFTAETIHSWNHIVTFGPFPVTIGSDGRTYPLRCRLAGRCTQSGTSGKLRLVVGSSEDTRLQLVVLYPTIPDNALQVNTSSTSNAWLTPWPPKTLLTIPDEVVRESMVSRTTIDSVGGDPIDVSVVMVYASVWGYSIDIGTSVVCSGAYIAEYVGV